MEPEVLYCDQCGAAYLRGVTICYSCGAPIGEPEQPTQPVKLPVHLRARTATVPMSPVPASVAAPAGVATRRPARPTAHPLSVALLAVSLVALVAGLVVLNYRLIPPGVPLSNVYRDPGRRFHVVQPALWQAAPYAGGVVLRDASGVTQVLVNLSPATGGETAAMRAEALRQALGLTPAPDLVTGGVTWTEEIGTVKSASGAERELLVLVSQHGDSFAIVECSSPATSFDADTRLVFLPLVRSFAFG